MCAQLITGVAKGDRLSVWSPPGWTRYAIGDLECTDRRFIVFACADAITLKELVVQIEIEEVLGFVNFHVKCGLEDAEPVSDADDRTADIIAQLDKINSGIEFLGQSSEAVPWLDNVFDFSRHASWGDNKLQTDFVEQVHGMGSGSMDLRMVQYEKRLFTSVEEFTLIA